MDGTTVQHYAQRLERLESAVLLLAVMLAAVTFALLVTAARAFKRRLILRDRHGVARLSVGMGQSDDPEVVVWGREGKSWVNLNCEGEGHPSLVASDREGRPRLCLSVGECGPYLCMLDAEGKPAMQAGMLKGDVPGVLIRDKAGRHRFDLCLDEAGAPYLVLFDGEDARRLAVGISPHDEPALVFFDRRGEERIGVGFDANGEPFLRVLDEAGNVVNQIHPSRPGADQAATDGNGSA
ncbi:MAG: hypothetical protein U0835_20165 [Isosphaeraceae bacterium]